MRLEDTPENRAKAEEFADRFEATLERQGSVATYFCAEQRQRWRQHAIRAFMGTSPDFTQGFSNPQNLSPIGFPPPLAKP